MKLVSRIFGITLALLLVVPGASATPVAQTKEERELYGRTFLEPVSSWNYIQLGEGGKGELEGGLKLLAKLFPRYLTFTTVGKELGSKHAVSVGPDGYPSWHNKDTGDGIPFHVAILTDKKVPDRKKEYVALMASHQAEPCGREGMYRLLEDLIIWATEDPEHTIDNATGASGETIEYTAKEILAKTKIYFMSPSPDGWRAGDGPVGGHSQYNGAGINSNRVAYQDGWVFPPDPVLYRQGYSTLTQPEGAAVIDYLLGIRERELNGKPFAVGMDLHGPFPLGFILLHDQGNDPQKLEQMIDLGTRIGQNMEETTPHAWVTDPALDQATEAVRQNIPDSRQAGTRDQNFWRQSAWARWSFVTHIADSLSYTAGSTWGGWMNSRSGLDSISLSYEINCTSGAPWEGVGMQQFVDNVKAVYETGLVTAAAMADDKEERFRQKIEGRAGFFESGERVTNRDGNPMPPPPNFPNNPFFRQIRQAPYDVSNTDYFRDLGTLVPNPPVEVRASGLRSDLASLDTFVVSDASVGDAGALSSFVKGGGNLILTDSALRMLPQLTKVGAKAVEKAWGYVGYSDLNRNHPWTHNLLATARQMFDPTGLGYPLLMERDGYWQDEGPQGASETKNSAPMWLVDRDAWEEAGGSTIGTADPPADRKQTSEGTNEDRTTIGIMESGKGRIVIFGALLPQPTEKYTHWFGLNGYTISAAGQTMLLRAMNWTR